MSNSCSYPIIGVINNKDSVAIVRSDGTFLYQNTNKTYSWSDSEYVTIKVVVASTETFEDPASIAFQNASTGMWIYGLDGDTITDGQTQKYYTLNQSIYQPWYKPFALFPGVSYIFGSTGYYFSPLVWYQAGYCGVPSGAQSAVDATSTWVKDEDRDCDDTLTGWTNQNDCQIAVPYKLCTYGNNCQTQCKGPCPTSNQSCVRLESQFVCKRNSFDFFMSWWMWFLLVSLILVIVITVLRLFYVRHKSHGRIQESEETSYDGT